MTRRNYIGLSTTPHDSALAIVDEHGTVVFAEATERYLQSKRAINVAPDMLYRTAQLVEEFCEPDTELVAAFSWSGNRERHHRALLQTIDSAEAALEKTFGAIPDYVLPELIGGRHLLRSNLGMEYLSGEALELELNRLPAWAGRPVLRRRYPHHLTHATAACLTSPFEEAVCAVVDGYGEDSSYAFYRYRDGELSNVDDVRTHGLSLTGSLGQFYERICQVCGFDAGAGEEWKVMGLAAYGHFDEGLYALFREMLVVKDLTLQQVSETRKLGHWRELRRMRRKLGESPLIVADVAYTAQQAFAAVLYELLNNLHSRELSSNLVLSGGCALNSAANGAILERTPFKSLHVFCAPADDGNAVGAALLAWREDHPEARVQTGFQTPYLGSRMSEQTLRNVRSFGAIANLVDCSGHAPERAARLLAEGKVIGWIQGRAEFGPRALGNRSILADARLAAMKDQLNTTVKFREEFRPFAPSILHEHGPAWFEQYQPSPYMERALRFRPEVRDRVPAVVHEDGTGRLQTVRREWNERFYRLIRHFFELTGVPLVLNTSFNVMGKPIAHSVEDVLAVFFSSGLHAVFIDDVLIEK